MFHNLIRYVNIYTLCRYFNLCYLHSTPPHILYRRLRNAKSRINTAFFVAKMKYLLKVYGKIELSRN